MKFLPLMLLVVYLNGCASNAGEKAIQPAHKDTIVKHDTIYISNNRDWQQGFDLTHDPEVDTVWGKPVKFYIENKQCSGIAIDFYYGDFRPSDNYTTTALLSLVTTSDQNLRPFYRWCLNKTIIVQDGALAEYTGVPAREYAEKFPAEFFKYMDSDASNTKYDDWTAAIAYSGFYDADDYKKPAAIRDRMIKKMKSNCGTCTAALKKRIEKLAMDCFPQINK